MRLDRPSAFESMEGWIERALLNARHVARYLWHPFRNSPAVLRAESSGSKDEQIPRLLC